MIQIQDLTKKFGAVVAVRDVSLDIKTGETFALLGPNGSGKTTILKCMIGLTHPTSGQVFIDGIDVWKRAREAKRLMSYLPQRVFFPDSLTARDVLRFYCNLRKIPISRIEKTLVATKFSFNGLAEKQVSDFSGGMVQRLGLAVACLPDAPVLVLDEPTISLDPEGAIHFREFLAALKREGRTIIFSSHMLADVEELADRVAILVGGRLVALQSIAALREELMRSSRMRVVLTNPADGLLEAARASGAEDVTLEGDSMVLTSQASDRLEILRAIESAGGRVDRFATEELSLEDIYMKYIREQDSQPK
ncbi:MAG: ABC transporter ATP-binding protein [Pyrinomonadaceae bacterium]|nr:ABC transporter ATP-binding protein [Pyrinomonadaceae bacterium]